MGWPDVLASAFIRNCGLSTSTDYIPNFVLCLGGHVEYAEKSIASVLDVGSGEKTSLILAMKVDLAPAECTDGAINDQEQAHESHNHTEKVTVKVSPGTLKSRITSQTVLPLLGSHFRGNVGNKIRVLLR